MATRMRPKIRHGKEEGFRNSWGKDGIGREALVTNGIWEERERKEDTKDSSRDSKLSDSERHGESDLRDGECGKPGVRKETRVISSVWGH